MGTHKDEWALDVISRIEDMGNSFGYVTADSEDRVTRGWVDVVWRMDLPFVEEPLYLLTAEIETSKSNWVQIRSNAAKSIPLKPLIHCHIFKPPVTLTAEERSQLEDIHHGRHILIYDANTDLDEFLAALSAFDGETVSKHFVAYVMVELNYACRGSLEAFIHDTPQIISASEILGDLDCIIVVDLKDGDFSKLQEIVGALHEKQLVRRSHTYLQSKKMKGI